MEVGRDGDDGYDFDAAVLGPVEKTYWPVGSYVTVLDGKRQTYTMSVFSDPLEREQGS